MGGVGWYVLVVGPVVGGTGVGFPIFHFLFFFHLPLYFLPPHSPVLQAPVSSPPVAIWSLREAQTLR